VTDLSARPLRGVYAAQEARRGGVLSVFGPDAPDPAREGLCAALAAEGWDVTAWCGEPAALPDPGAGFDAVIGFAQPLDRLFELMAATGALALVAFDPPCPFPAAAAELAGRATCHVGRLDAAAILAAGGEIQGLDGAPAVYAYDADRGFILSDPAGDAAMLAGLRLRRQLLRAVGGRDSGA